MMKLSDWREHGYSWVYIMVNFVLFILGFVFWQQEPMKVNVADVELMDAPYLAFLLEFYTTGITYGPNAAATAVIATSLALPPITKLSLETLGAYSTSKKNPTKPPKQMYGLEYAQISPAQHFFVDSAAIRAQMSNDLYTAAGTDQVLLASPLWAYEHNLQILSEACTDVERANAIAANRIGVNPLPVRTIAPAVPVVPVVPAVPVVPVVPVVPARILQCSPAYPTRVDYKQCYKTLTWHKRIFGFYSITSMLLWIASVVSYGFISDHIVYVQRFSLLYHVGMVAILSVAINYGLPALTETCPDKQTGLSSLYQIFITVFAGILLVVSMQIANEVHVMYLRMSPAASNLEDSSDSESTKDAMTVEPGSYSCNFA